MAEGQSTEELAPWIERAKAGDRAALEHVLAEVAPSVYRFGLRMCGNAHDADDVLQDTLVQISQHLGQFEGRAALTSWVFTLARTACSRRRRGLKNRPAEGDDRLAEEQDRAPSPEARAEASELGASVLAALDGLPDDYREVLVLRDVEGLSARETADALELSVDAVKSRLHRARSALRIALRPLREAPPPTCPDVAEQWSKKLEGDLSEGDCASMERHLTTCPTCGAACAALREALVACQRVRTVEVPPEIRERVRAALREWQSPELA